MRERKLQQAAVVRQGREEFCVVVRNCAEGRRVCSTPFGSAVVPTCRIIDVVRRRRRRQARARVVFQRFDGALTGGGLSAHGEHVLEIGRLGAHRGRQLAMIDAAHHAGNHQHPGFRLAADEGHLALAVDRDDRIRHRADAVDRGGQRRALEPVRQLPGDDVAGAHAELAQRHRHAVGALLQIAVGELPAAFAPAFDDERALRVVLLARVEQRRDGRLRPFPARLMACASLVRRTCRLHRVALLAPATVRT